MPSVKKTISASVASCCYRAATSTPPKREALEAALLATGLVDKVSIRDVAAPMVEQHIEIVEFEREL